MIIVTLTLQCLTLYTLACIMSNSYFPEETKRSQLLDTLKVLENWNACDDIAALANHQTVRRYLLTWLKSVNKMHETRDDGPNVRPRYQTFSVSHNSYIAS